MPTYLYDIPSLVSKHPAITEIQNFLVDVDLNRILAKGSEIQRNDVREAKKIAEVVRALQGTVDVVQKEVVEDAEDRALVIQTAYAASSFGAHGVHDEFANIHDTLARMDAKLNRMNLRTEVLVAEVANTRIVHRNSRRRGDEFLDPLQKSVPGSGYVKAIAVMGNHPVTDAPSAVIGATPPAFNRDIDGYTYAYVAELIVFYNQDFGIQPNETLPSQRLKFRAFLTE